MATGKEHDKSTKRWVVPFTLIIGFVLDLQSGLISGAAFLAGGLWLSPDLDTHSISLNRWGFLKNLWWPYRKLIPHRSIISHGPFLGTAVRVSYLLSVIALIIGLLKLCGLGDVSETVNLLTNQIRQHPTQVFAAFIGLEASAWLHLIKDGDPLPK